MADRAPAGWLLALPRALPAAPGWLPPLAAGLLAAGTLRGVAGPVAAGCASPLQAEVPRASRYPAFDLTDAHDALGPHLDPVWHNVDGPRLLADRLRHAWDAFGLGGGDACLLVAAGLADLEGLWAAYAHDDPATLPCTVVHLAGAAVPGLPEPGPATRATRLAWAAARLAGIGALARKVLVWAEHPGLAQEVAAAGFGPAMPAGLAGPVAAASAAGAGAGGLVAALQAAVAEAGASQPDIPPVAVHIAPAWAAAGSSHVFAAQLDWLAGRGWPTICLHLDTDDLGDPAGPAARARLAALPGARALQRWFLTRPPSLTALEDACGMAGGYRRQLSFEGEQRIARQVALPDSLLRFLRHRPVRCVVLNYGHNWPLLPRLGLDQAPVILEAHDVRPIQHAIAAAEPAAEPVALAAELASFARADAAVFINAAERDRFLAAHPSSRAVHAVPFGALRRTAQADVAAWLQAPRLPLSLVRELARPPAERRQRVLLFVGSPHPANVHALRWLLTRCWPHGLHDPRLALLVVGGVAEAVAEARLPNLHLVGPVADPQAFVRAADVMLLPIRDGTGLPVKLLDALAAGCPFVATSRALAGLPDLAAAIPAHDAPEAFAGAAASLALDTAAAAALRQRIAAFVAGPGAPAVYRRCWDDLAAALGIDAAPGGLAMPPPRQVRFGVPAPGAAWECEGLSVLEGAAAVPAFRATVACPAIRLAGPHPALRLRMRVAGPPGTMLALAVSSAPGLLLRPLGAEAVPVCQDLPHAAGPEDAALLQMRLVLPPGATPADVRFSGIVLEPY